MIRSLQPDSLAIEFPEATDEELAEGIAANAEFKKNVAWWNAHAKEIVPQHVGKFVCVAGQELFVGEDPIEVVARARAAHPNPGAGFLSFRIPTHQGPMIHANRW
jgi:hypothetical protein